jgi:hypothetical protein
VFEQFYSLTVSALRDCGADPTYIAASGIGYPEEMKPIASQMHSKLIRSNFSGITLLSIVANPTGSDEPAYDGFAEVSLGYHKSKNELGLCLCVNEAYVPLDSAAFDGLMRSLLVLHTWDFGFGFRAPATSKPDFYILGIDDGERSPAEYKALCTWYASSPEQRVSKLRDVHPYNILNATQLAQPIGGDTLLQLARRHGSLTPLAQDGLFLWHVAESDVPHIRSQLAGSEALLQ